MKYRDIRRHLRPYSIVASRSTTINHAFAAAVAPVDEFEDQRVREAIEVLQQDPDSDLRCVYCGDFAETWDHVKATVKNKEFSGYGHRLGNLLPSCKRCNSRKGNRAWDEYLNTIHDDVEEIAARKLTIQAYLSKYEVVDAVKHAAPEYEELQNLRRQILRLFAEADRLATQLRMAQGKSAPK